MSVMARPWTKCRRACRQKRPNLRLGSSSGWSQDRRDRIQHLLLHYEPPESIDWPRILNANRVRLLLPMQVVDELDEKKYTGSDKVRKKAHAILPHSRAWLAPTAPQASRLEPASRSRCWVSVEQHNPDADRSIIETCIELQQLAGQPNTVTLVTGNAGIRMRAAQRGVRVVMMPEDYLRVAPMSRQLRILRECDQGNSPR